MRDRSLKITCITLLLSVSMSCVNFCVQAASQITRPNNSRRSFLVATTSSALIAQPCMALTAWESADLEKKSLTAEGVMLDNGVRVIDLLVGDGPEPVEGQQVYITYKFWRTRFNDGMPVDSTILQDKGPANYTLGSPTGRVFKGLDLGVRGMKDGGWRRLVIPPELGFGDEGYPYNPRSSKAVPPGATLYVDVRLVDGGSGRCRSAAESFTSSLVNVKEINICKY